MIKILLLMIFCHLIDDFVLQDKFTYLKQKSWWVKTCNEEGLSLEKYGKDYMMALFEHSLEWSIAIMLPVIFLCNTPGLILLVCVIVNTIIHYIVDNAKANQLRLNLIQDQLIHFIQIILTWILII
jgi:ABC-type transport system involved in cytochrome bd biosynthesis fused ATPase/permease subunit